MSEYSYKYIVVGGGLAGASAADGIRKVDKNNQILLIGQEKTLPYQRPPLTKDLWSAKIDLNQIFIHSQKYYDDNDTRVVSGSRVLFVDIERKSILADDGNLYRFEKLLLATGGIPRHLPVAGGNLDDICYYRYIDDYLKIKDKASEGRSALVVGGGFIGSEIAAALATGKTKVTMLFPEPTLLARVFPEYLGKAVGEIYKQEGVDIIMNDRPVSFSKEGETFIAITAQGRKIRSDMVIIGAGISPSTELARSANMEIDNGIKVDTFLRTTHFDVYAAGDNTSFPCQALAKRLRVEHWDNARSQGICAGMNMAGADEPYTHIPSFFSTLFDSIYEAVGEINAKLTAIPEWQKENETGIIYYISDNKVNGVLMCNMPGKIEEAREIVRKRTIPAHLRTAAR